MTIGSLFILLIAFTISYLKWSFKRYVSRGNLESILISAIEHKVNEHLGRLTTHGKTISITEFNNLINNVTKAEYSKFWLISGLYCKLSTYVYKSGKLSLDETVSVSITVGSTTTTYDIVCHPTQLILE